MCGLNVPLTSFDPQSLDLDLKLVSFRGLGRGKGFALSEMYSVLGDDYYSSMAADRVISLSKLFLDEGIISFNQIFERLGLDDEILNSGNYVTKNEYDKVIVQNMNYQGQLMIERENFRKIQYRLNSIKLDMEKKEKERKMEKIVNSILARIIQGCDVEIIEDDKFSWIVIVNKINVPGLLFLRSISKDLGEDVRKRLRVRLKGKDTYTKFMLEKLILKKKKSVTDIILENLSY